MENTLQKTLAPISDGLKDFEHAFAAALGDHAGLIGAMASHVLSSPGKRIRPAMYLLTSSIAPAGDRPTPIDGAVAIELIHTATLLHDDVNDSAEERRGRPAVNRLWGNLSAVLMGDHLFAKAFRIMVRLGDPRILDAISHATERVAVGELLQVQEIRNFQLHESGYLRIIGDKTASLFAAACESGSLLSGSDRWATQFRAFGESVGLGFQIADDLLDYVGDQALTGKPVGNDLREGKVTLPLIFALQKGPEAERRHILDHISNGHAESSFSEVVGFVEQYGGFAYARQRAEQFCAKALDAIKDVGDSVHKQALESVVNHVVSRQS